MSNFPFTNSKNKNIPFIIYGTKKCPFCNKTKKILIKKNIPFIYYDIHKLIQKNIIKNIQNFKNKIAKKTNNYNYVPVIFLYGKFIGGYNELKKIIKQINI